MIKYYFTTSKTEMIYKGIGGRNEREKEALRMEILKYIEKQHSRVELGELAVVGVEETDVANEIADMEKEKIICGYIADRLG